MKIPSALRLPGLLLGAALLLAQEGCSNACLALASQICQCLPEDGTRAACNQRAKDGSNSFPIASQDEAFCQRKLDEGKCDCKQLNTAEGKLACGLSYPTTP